MQFITPVKVVLADESLESKADVSIKWDLVGECRQWGLKYVEAQVPDQVLEVEVEEYDEDSDDYKVKTRRIELTDCDAESIAKVPVCPTELECIKGKWILKF